MAYRASRPVKVAAWTKTAVAAAQAAPAVAADFTNLFRSTMTHSGGFAQGEYALLPDQPSYDKIRVLFGPTTLGNADNTATLTLWARLADGSVIAAGNSVLAANKTFPVIEVDNYQATYHVTVSAIGGTTPALTVDAFVQGVHVGYVD